MKYIMLQGEAEHGFQLDFQCEYLHMIRWKKLAVDLFIIETFCRSKIRCYFRSTTTGPKLSQLGSNIRRFLTESRRSYEIIFRFGGRVHAVATTVKLELTFAFGNTYPA